MLTNSSFGGSQLQTVLQRLELEKTRYLRRVCEIEDQKKLGDMSKEAYIRSAYGVLLTALRQAAEYMEKKLDENYVHDKPPY